MSRKVGRYTKYETAELTRMFSEGHSVYKICRNLNRSQNSIRNNLIRIGLMEGVITKRKYEIKTQKIENYSFTTIIFNKFFYIIFISILTFLMLVYPRFNLQEMSIYGWVQIVQFIFLK